MQQEMYNLIYTCTCIKLHIPVESRKNNSVNLMNFDIFLPVNLCTCTFNRCDIFLLHEIYPRYRQIVINMQQVFDILKLSLELCNHGNISLS